MRMSGFWIMKPPWWGIQFPVELSSQLNSCHDFWRLILSDSMRQAVLLNWEMKFLSTPQPSGIWLILRFPFSRVSRLFLLDPIVQQNTGFLLCVWLSLNEWLPSDTAGYSLCKHVKHWYQLRTQKWKAHKEYSELAQRPLCPRSG